MQQSKPFPRVLTIAGSDSGGGAGIQADLKTFGALGAYGASVITAVTAQNTQGVQGVHVVPAAMIAAQCDSVLSDIRIDAVKIGMLADLAEQFSGVQATFAEASEAVGFDLWHIAQSGEGLDQTEFTQPVLLTASIALWRVWLELGGVVPKCMAGHSLGEYSALVAAGAMSLGDAVKLVHLRGKLMQSAVPQGQGAMAAILGLDDAKVLELCEQANMGARLG